MDSFACMIHRYIGLAMSLKKKNCARLSPCTIFFFQNSYLDKYICVSRSIHPILYQYWTISDNVARFTYTIRHAVTLVSSDLPWFTSSNHKALVMCSMIHKRVFKLIRDLPIRMIDAIDSFFPALQWYLHLREIKGFVCLFVLLFFWNQYAIVKFEERLIVSIIEKCINSFVNYGIHNGSFFIHYIIFELN